jgi:hypothetical protein
VDEGGEVGNGSANDKPQKIWKKMLTHDRMTGFKSASLQSEPLTFPHYRLASKLFKVRQGRVRDHNP